MKLRKYRSTALGAIIGSGVFCFYYGIRAHYEGTLRLFLISFVIAIPFGIYIGKKTAEFIKGKISGNIVVLDEKQSLRHIVYALLVGNLFLVIVFVVFVFLFFGKAQGFHDSVFRQIANASSSLFGFWTGSILVASLIQYVWINSWEKKEKMTLLESEDEKANKE
jgi:hypothetical protein